MNSHPSADKGLPSRAFVAIAIAVVVFILFGLLAASYTLFLTVVAAMVLAAVLLFIMRRLSRRQRLGVIAAVAAVGVAGAALLLMRGGGELYPSAIIADVPAYSVTIRPDKATGSFVASEEANVKLEDFAAPSDAATRVKQTVNVAAHSKGLFIEEVTLTPLAGLRVSLPDGTQVSPMLVTDMDAKLVVKLQDLPKGSFYAARHALGLSSYPYLDTETLTWSPTDLGEDITFAYIKPPAHHLRALLGPFLTVSSASQWLVGTLAALLTALFGAFVQPALLQKLKDTLSPWLPSWMKESKRP